MGNAVYTGTGNGPGQVVAITRSQRITLTTTGVAILRYTTQEFIDLQNNVANWATYPSFVTDVAVRDMLIQVVNITGVSTLTISDPDYSNMWVGNWNLLDGYAFSAPPVSNNWPPIPGQTFESAVASTQWSSVADYVFGSAAVAGAGQTAIRNVSDLATFFNYYQVGGANHFSINGEMQRYVDFTNSANFVFNANDLTLQATIDAGFSITYTKRGVVTASQTYADGTVIALSNTDMTTTAGITVGQICIVQNVGIYRISAVVADTSFTIAKVGNTGGATNQIGKLIIFVPTYWTTMSAPYVVGDGHFTVNAVPAGVNTSGGQFVQLATSAQGTPGDSGVTAITSVTGAGTVINLSQESWQNWPSGTPVFIGPPIRAAEIWTKDTFAVTTPPYQNITRIAMELTAVPASSGSSLTQPTSWANVNPNGGNFYGWWLYGNPAVAVSEIDIWEAYYGMTTTSYVWGGGNNTQGAGNNNSVTYYNTTLPGFWLTQYNLYFGTTDYGNKAHKYGLLWDKSNVWKYVDSTLYRQWLYNWAGASPASNGTNLAVGTYFGGLGSNMAFPYTDADLAGNKLAIQRLRILKSTVTG